MISLLQVHAEMAEISDAKWHQLKPGQVTKLKARRTFLTLVKHYLETAPSEDFIASEKSRIDKYLKTINERFNLWVANNSQKSMTLKEQQKAFEKEYDIKKLKSQQRALSFILNKKPNEVIES